MLKSNIGNNKKINALHILIMTQKIFTIVFQIIIDTQK